MEIGMTRRSPTCKSGVGAGRLGAKVVHSPRRSRGGGGEQASGREGGQRGPDG